MNGSALADHSDEENRRQWTVLVTEIRGGSQSAMERLYMLLRGGMRLLLSRHLGTEDIEDKIHDIFLVVVNAIRRDQIRDPACLMGFAWTVARRLIAHEIEGFADRRKRHARVDCDSIPDSQVNLEADLIGSQHQAVMLDILLRMSARDREVLARFYLQNEPRDEICAKMNMTETQFRLLKSRAKARFVQRVRAQARRAGRLRKGPATPSANARTGHVASPTFRFGTSGGKGM